MSLIIEIVLIPLLASSYIFEISAVRRSTYIYTINLYATLAGMPYNFCKRPLESRTFVKKNPQRIVLKISTNFRLRSSGGILDFF
jgi:hypothetical protein